MYPEQIVAVTIRTTKWPPSNFFRLGKHTPRPDDAAIFFCLATISSSMATGWKGVFIFYLLNFFFMCKVPGDLSRYKSTHELSYVVRGNLEPGKRRGARGRDMDVLSGFPVGHPSWGVPPRESGSRGASRGACRASRSEQNRAEFLAEDGPRFDDFLLYYFIKNKV